MEIVQRQWDRYYVLDSGKNYKVKKLIISPGKSLSMQRHLKRDELWQVVSGKGRIFNDDIKHFIQPTQVIHILKEEWHQVENLSDTEPLVIIEIQTGICEESDIERRN